MSFEKTLLFWALGTLIIAMGIGGRPWVFPENGRLIIEEMAAAQDGIIIPD
jgi:hypothetical protein